VKRRKRTREIIPVIKHHNRTIIPDTNEKANISNSYYISIFRCDRNIQEIKFANWVDTFIDNTRVIRKRLAKFVRNESVGPDGIPGEILKLVGEAITPYPARLLEISLISATIRRDLKIATMFPIYRGGLSIGTLKL
jgi:hypothetical protein